MSEKPALEEVELRDTMYLVANALAVQLNVTFAFPIVAFTFWGAEGAGMVGGVTVASAEIKPAPLKDPHPEVLS
jgi:hypothetical protein